MNPTPLVKRLIHDTSLVFRAPYFGFLSSHDYLTALEIDELRLFIGGQDRSAERKVENSFGAMCLRPHGIAFAAGRMAFYSLLRSLDIGPKCEVVLNAGTCAVMAAAVIRVGARPVFSDVDPTTFGSSPEGIAAVITPRTRMIVAQHSFGIPCRIKEIVSLAKQNGIFVLEDCALTLSSTIGDHPVGSIGDGALFSTDHSKPINSITGGVVCVSDASIAARLRGLQEASLDLSGNHQLALWRAFARERRYSDPNFAGRLPLIDFCDELRTAISHQSRGYLNLDDNPAGHKVYPYPARLPEFLAQLAIRELERWPSESKLRSEFGIRLTDLVQRYRGTEVFSRLPGGDSIVPLRLAWIDRSAQLSKQYLGRHLRVDQTWFMSPLVATRYRLDVFGYEMGSCPIAENIGPSMINIPCNVAEIHQDLFCEFISKALAEKI